MKILDMNTVLGGRKPSNGELVTEQTLFQYMDDYRIDRCVAYHHMALSNPLWGNEQILRVAQKSNGRIGACLVLDPILTEESVPGSGNLSQRLGQCQPEAVRICPDNVELPFHKLYWKELLNELKGTNIPVIVDCTYTTQFFALLPDVLAAYPEINFVLLRCGFRKQRMIAPLLREYDNLYFDMSIMIDAWQLEQVYEIDACKHLVFGSGFPRMDPTGPYGMTVYAQIPKLTKEGILYENWEVLHK